MSNVVQRPTTPRAASTQSQSSVSPVSPVSPVSLMPTPASDVGDLAETEAFYLHAKVFTTLQHAAVRQGTADWRVYARERLDAALAAHALLLDPIQAEAVRQYAQALDIAPEELLAQLLAPEMVRRERRRRQIISFVQRHHPRPPRGCLLPIIWGGALLCVCALGLLALLLCIILLHAAR